MTSWIFILGTNPALSVEEILTVLKLTPEVVIELGKDFIVLECEQEIDPSSLLRRLGGTIKIGRVRHHLSGISQLTPELWRETLSQPETKGKFIFGFSQYGLPKSAYALQGIGLKVKKILKAEGSNARLMANREGQLSSVAVEKNDLVGAELLITRGSRSDVYVGLTEAVQDFEHYGSRDYGRPERDSARGMLPPKLAQMMINFATVPVGGVMSDPFCGLGTVAQEAWLIDSTAQIVSSDSDPQAVAQAEKNFAWLLQGSHEHRAKFVVASVEQLSSIVGNSSLDAVITEPYLGPARELQRTLTTDRLQQIIQEVSTLYLKAFHQFSQVVRPGGRVIMVWPMYLHHTQYELLPIMSEVTKIGFNPILPAVRHTPLASELTERGTLWYHRADQAVAREIVLWQKN